MPPASKFRRACILIVLLLLAAIPLHANENCCHVSGWFCQSDEQWQHGFYAFHGLYGYNAGTCQASTASASSQSTSMSPSPTPASPTAETWQTEENCCYADGWNCPQDDEGAWARGYYAYHAGECDQPERWRTNFPIDPAITDPFQYAEEVNKILSTAPHLGARQLFPSTVPEYFDQTLQNQIDNRPDSYNQWREENDIPVVTEQDKVKAKLCLDLGLFCNFGESGA